MRFLMTALAIAVSAPAVAQGHSVLFHRTDPASGTDDIYLGEYADRAAFLSGNALLTKTAWELNPDFSIGGFEISDGGAISVLFFRTDPASGTDDIYLGEYPDRAGFLAGNAILDGTAWELNSDFSIGGFGISDAGAISVLFFRTDPESGTDDIYLGEYADRAGFLAGNALLTKTAWELNSDFSIGGFEVSDGGAISVLFFRTDPASGTDDIYLGEYADRAGFLAGNAFLDGTAWELNPDFSLGGLSLADLAPPPSGVPEPGNWALMIAGFGLVGALARRQRALRLA